MRNISRSSWSAKFERRQLLGGKFEQNVMLFGTLGFVSLVRWPRPGSIGRRCQVRSSMRYTGFSVGLADSLSFGWIPWLVPFEQRVVHNILERALPDC